jgi:hypothetical protein
MARRLFLSKSDMNVGHLSIFRAWLLITDDSHSETGIPEGFGALYRNTGIPEGLVSETKAKFPCE